MMHRCSGSHGHCSCGVFHNNSHYQGNSFSMLFSMPNAQKPYDEADRHHMYSFASSSPSSSVDCTLSLGTPSTRLTNNNDVTAEKSSRRSSSSSNCMSNFCWDILHSNNKHSSDKSSSGRGSNSSSSHSAAGETLLARRCANCDTTSTPLWRNGPKGPKSLCNACGIRFKKEERRASAAAATNGNSGAVDGQHMLNSSWLQNQKVPYISSAYGNEFRLVDEDDHRDSESGIPFLSWRLNVTDRPAGLVHEFTR